MMMGDNRACAMAVNDLLTPREKAGPKLCERQVEEHPRCFLFGHYDSRGGASLVKARNLIEAFEKYAESFGWAKDPKTGQLEDEGMRQYMKSEGEYEAWKPDALHWLMEEDFMFSCNVIVCDEPFADDNVELDRAYCDDRKDGYSYGVLQYRWLHEAYLAQDEEWIVKDESNPPTEEDLRRARTPSKWGNVSSGCKKTLVFWKGKERPTIDPKALGLHFQSMKGLELRIVKKSYGEDACGVCWQP